MHRSARPLSRPVFALLFALAAIIAVEPAKATSVLFSTGPQMLGGREIDATATFDIEKVGDTAWTIAATVLDMEDNPTDVSQLISSVQFTIGRPTIPGSPTVASSDATDVNIAKNGIPTLSTSTIAWGWATSVSTNSVLLCTVCPAGVKGDAPKELLIGDPNSNGRYDNANGSIAGNDPHNPFLLASGPDTIFRAQSTLASPSWTIAFSGLSAGPTITSVTFGFGTTYGEYDLTLGAVPEPASWALLAIGILLICLGRIRIRRFQSLRGPRCAGQ